MSSEEKAAAVNAMSVEERAAVGVSGEYSLARIECDQVVSVSFKSGARTGWHAHPGGVQTLICVKGRGWVQFWEGEGFELTPGSVVAIPDGVKHWHGALPGEDMEHIALVPAGASILLEKVTD
jgi:quercetin dioxygenase-like cupin family protein